MLLLLSAVVLSKLFSQIEDEIPVVRIEHAEILGSVTTSVYESPFAFAGGTIRDVTVDVSGDAYVDMELEALAAMKRD